MPRRIKPRRFARWAIRHFKKMRVNHKETVARLDEGLEVIKRATVLLRKEDYDV